MAKKTERPAAFRPAGDKPALPAVNTFGGMLAWAAADGQCWQYRLTGPDAILEAARATRGQVILCLLADETVGRGVALTEEQIRELPLQVTALLMVYAGNAPYGNIYLERLPKHYQG